MRARTGRSTVAATVLGLVVTATLTGCASLQFTTGDRPVPSPSAPAASAVATLTPTAEPTPTVTPPPVLLSPSSRSTPGSTVPVRGYVLGDSISLAVAPLLSRLGYPVVGKVGQSASDAYLRDNLSTEAAQSAPAWVIVLGTNNRGDAVDVAAIPRWLDLIDDLRPDDIPVYWVTPYRPPSYVGGMSGTNLDAFNAELIAQASKRRWLGIIDYAYAASFHDEWFESDGQHLHPDRAGQGVLAAMIAGPEAVPADAPAPVVSLGPPTPPEPTREEPPTFTNTPRPEASPAPPPSPADPTPSAPAEPTAPAESPAPSAPAASAPAASAEPAG